MPSGLGIDDRRTPTTRSELHIDVNHASIAAHRAPQGTIPFIAIGSMGTGAGNAPATCSVADTDPQLTVDTTRSTVKGTFLLVAVSRKRKWTVKNHSSLPIQRLISIWISIIVHLA